MPDLIKLQISIAVFKAKNKMLPCYVQEFFVTNCDSIHLTLHRKNMKRVCLHIFDICVCVNVYVNI